MQDEKTTEPPSASADAAIINCATDDVNDVNESFRSSLSSTTLRKSAYMLALIEESEFIRQGATSLGFGLYFKKQIYDGTHMNETVALLGVPMIQINQFFIEDSDLLCQIKALTSLQFISNVEELSCSHTCDILKKFKQFFDVCESNYLLLLNIEPCGEDGKYKRIYPYPRITIPGGTMEAADYNDFLQCAIREFREETHVELNDNYDLICQKKINKDIRKGNKKSYRIFSRYQHFSRYSYYEQKPTKIERMYYMIRMK